MNTPTLDPSAWATQHALVWGTHTDELADTVLVISGKPATGGWTTFGSAPAGDADAAWAIASRAHTAGATDVYVSVGALAAAPVSGRGRAEDVALLPALIVDIDTRDDGGSDAHRTTAPLPTLAEARAWLAGMPVRPSLLVGSGHGLHGWFTLDTPLNPHSDQGKGLLERWEAFWQAQARLRGWGLDRGVASDPARVLRVAGTLNSKGGTPTPVTVLDAPGGFTYIEDMEAILPPVPEAPPASVTVPRGDVTDGDDDRPGALLDRLPGALEALLADQGLRPVQGDPSRWVYPRPDGSYSRTDSHGWVRVDEGGVARVWAAPGTRLEAAWGMERQQWGAFRLLTQRYCGGDFGLAARVARGVTDAESLTSRVHGSTVESLTGRFGRVDESALVTGADGVVTVEPAAVVDVPTSGQPGLPASITIRGVGRVGWTARLSDALASPTPMAVPVSLTATDLDERFVIVDSRRSYGLWRSWDEKIETADGTQTVRRHGQVTTWVAWQASLTQDLVAGADGRPVPAGEALTTVEILTDRGARITLPGLGADDADSLRRIVAMAHAGLEIPEDRGGVERAANAMRRLAIDERAHAVRYAVTGWVRDPEGRWVFAAPGGSVDARGPRPDFVVTDPIGSTEGALMGTAMAEVAVDRLPSTPEAGASAIRELFDVVPATVAVALVGAIFAAPLNLATRGVPFIQGEQGSGKSVLAGLLMGILTGRTASKNDAPISLPDASRAGVQAIAGWARHLPLIVDDWRVEGVDPSRVGTVRDALTAAVQAGYGTALSAKATRAGGLRGARPSQATTIITGELGPLDDAMTARSIHLIVRKGDIRLLGQPNALDTWVARYAATGEAQGLFGAYVRWLAGRVEASGGLTDFTAAMEAVRRGWSAPRGGTREVETVSAPAAGWGMLYEWAAENGALGALPPRATVDAALDALASTNARIAAERSLGQRLVDALGALIASGAGHLVTTNNEAPADGARWGWAQRRQTGDLEGQGVRVGWITGRPHTPDSDRFVIVSVSGLQAAWRQVAPGSDFVRSAAEQAIAGLVDGAGTTTGGPLTKRRFGAGETRREGYVFTLEALGLEGDPLPPKVPSPALAVRPEVPEPKPERLTVPAMAGAPAGELPPYDDIF